MNDIRILWADDEIEFLKPHILFLEKRGYSVTSCQSGNEAIEEVQNETFDIVFLDEHMPGLTGLETLTEIKKIESTLPIVMVTKSEEESIMEDAIGAKISDYLIKPVNPHQLLLSLKKTLDHSKLISEKTTSNYQQEFREIAMNMASINSYQEWVKIYDRLVYWEIQLEEAMETGMTEILESQKKEANIQFCKFISDHYKGWFSEGAEAPILSHKLFREKVVPELSREQPTLMVVIDNMRLDQWKSFEPILKNYYSKSSESAYYSILPTTTQYARNAIFSGLMPLEMEQKFPELWSNDNEDKGKNLHEKEFLEAQMKRMGLSFKTQYHKIANLKSGQKFMENFEAQKTNDLTVVVYNFVDMLSHSKTEMEVIKELASNDKSYRSLTKSWFSNSSLLEIIQKAQNLGFKLIITTDHGTINAQNPSKVIGDKNTSLNLRYKTGRSLTYNKKDVVAAKNPEDFNLPRISLSHSFIFAKENSFFVYPNNYNYYVNYFRQTYQHGGVSLEEMIIPFVVMQPR